jgi:hypothetical protein
MSTRSAAAVVALPAVCSTVVPYAQIERNVGVARLGLKFELALPAREVGEERHLRHALIDRTDALPDEELLLDQVERRRLAYAQRREARLSHLLEAERARSRDDASGMVRREASSITDTLDAGRPFLRRSGRTRIQADRCTRYRRPPTLLVVGRSIGQDRSAGIQPVE